MQKREGAGGKENIFNRVGGLSTILFSFSSRKLYSTIFNRGTFFKDS